MADQHIPIRPGTDALLLLGLLHTVFTEERLRPGRTARVTDGLEDMARAAAPFSPETVAPATGVPAGVIRELARDFAAAEPAVAYGRVGVSMQEFGGLASWLINVLNAVTGNLDRPGGAMFTRPAVDLVALADRIGQRGHFDKGRSRVRGLPEFSGEYPVAVLAEEIGPAKERAGAFVYFLFAYDTLTREQRLITQLGDEDDGRFGIRDPEIQVSPDRRWIALTADFFRVPEDEDLGKLLPTNLWLVSVDGRQHRRLTASITRPAGVEMADAHVFEPRWSGDGQTLFFAQFFSYHPTLGPISVAVFAKAVPVGGGPVNLLPTGNLGCAQHGGAAPSPSGQTLLVPMDVCNSASLAGIHEYTAQPFSGKRQIAAQVSRPKTPVWFPDGSGALYVAEGRFQNVGTGSYVGQAVYRWLAASNENVVFFQPASSAEQAKRVTISPNGRSVVLESAREPPGTSTLWRASPHRVKLTNTGNNISPAW